MAKRSADSDLACSFCGRRQPSIKLIAGPTIMICSECVATSVELAGEGASGVCSFCGKSPPDLVQPPSPLGLRALICGQCLALCQDIVRENLR
ncbi:MAG: ClpX C4-type zinc finger protein [Steroidobacteraceae bacterium]